MSITSLQGRKCLITGAASGIGRATALAAAAEGAELVLTDIQAGALDTVVAEIRQGGGNVLAHRALDITDLAAVRSFADDIHATHGSLDVLMNIAGISVWGTIDKLAHSDWRQAVEVNLMGPIHVLETFVPPMIAAGRGGHIVNVSSAAGLFGLPWHAAYSATKFGLRGISEVLRFDLQPHGIGVSLVCPGAVNTPLVGTVRIVGINRTDPRVQKLVGRFQRHAVTPERAAAAILRGIKKNRYMVFTSPDILLGYWSQRFFPLPYEWVMRFISGRVNRLVKELEN